MTSKETTLAAILVGLIIVCGSVCFVVSVNHDRAIHLKRIDAAIEWKQQDQETERTEERSQFWQKAVPWGKDEAEDPAGFFHPEEVERPTFEVPPATHDLHGNPIKRNLQDNGNPVRTPGPPPIR